MYTIRDVARLAGVSVGTVSNYINGKENVNEDKIE
ncbi:LacI family DNA-binding transcriptional regulator, partial [Lachnotalea glycerini]